MPLLFKGSPHSTLGVEIEVQLIDPQTLDLVPRAEEILEECKKRNIKRVKAEMHQSMIEIDTEISENVAACFKSLSHTLKQLFPIADELNILLAITGTHPFQNWEERLVSKGKRYDSLLGKYQWLIRRMNIYGVHVHVGVSSKEEVLYLSNAMRSFLPHLLALSANSPFWHKTDTGMQSSRINMVDSFPFGGMNPYFSNWEEFEHYYETLEKVGAVSTLKDFYWYIRPNLNFGTLELRICDGMSTLKETMAVVALIHCLIVDLKKKQGVTYTKEHSWIALENQWSAARDGLNASFILDLDGNRSILSDEIRKLVLRLEPLAMDLGCEKELQDVLSILENGNGATRQRDLFSKTKSFDSIVLKASEELRQSCP